MLMCPSFQLAYIGLNTEEAPFNDKRVRQAINYAIDKLVRALFENLGTPQQRNILINALIFLIQSKWSGFSGRFFL